MTDRIKAPIRRLTVPGRDGTALGVYVCGTGPHRWLLPPGLGTPLLSWKYLFENFHRRMTIATWDPRGCYASAAPSDPARLTVEDHTDDAVSVTEALGWTNGGFVTGGWSMGVEVGLEIYSRMPDRIAGLVLINGAFEHVLRTAFNLPGADAVLVAVLKGMIAATPVFAPLAAYLLRRPWAVPVLKTARLVAANESFFGEVVADFAALDFATYFKMIARLNEHSAKDVLTSVRVPTLITAGSADKMTPLSVARRMHEVIAGSELFVIPGGTHYTLLEYPEILNLKIEQFFRRTVFGEAFDRV